MKTTAASIERIVRYRLRTAVRCVVVAIDATEEPPHEASYTYRGGWDTERWWGCVRLGGHDTIKQASRNITFRPRAPAMRQTDFSDNIRSNEALESPTPGWKRTVEGVENHFEGA